MLPPRIVRRLVVAPLVFVGGLLFLLLSPLLGLAALIVDLGARWRWRTLRFFMVLLV